MRTLAFWLLFPLLIPQALWVRRAAPRFGGAPGPRSGRVGSGRRFRLVGLGDSVIDGVGCASLETALVGRTAAALAARLDAQIEWSATARTGADTRRIRRRLLPGAAIDAADFVVVSTGVNDVTGLTRLDDFRTELERLLDDIRARAPSAAIAINGLPPMHRFPSLPQPLRFTLGLRARQLDAVVAAVADARAGVKRIAIEFEAGPEGRAERFAPDGYHPSERSCAELAGAISRALVPSTGSAGTQTA